MNILLRWFRSRIHSLQRRSDGRGSTDIIHLFWRYRRFASRTILQFNM